MKISNLKKTFKNKKVIVTGHTGFKGAWLTFWLKKLGANILGISYNSKTKPSIFKTLNLKDGIKNKNLDIRNLKKLRKELQNFKPDFVFHLAAQSLVKKSYQDPVYTIETNSIGTLNLLESLKKLKKKCTAIFITSDKSYKNLELKRGYRENDILGGIDPYSASKACAEMIIYSQINSFFNNGSKIKIGIARAGNVIGGGDWSTDRLVPDCIRSWSKNKKVLLRNPEATRPWQHVFEAIGAYLIFATNLNLNKKFHGEVFNFGPNTNRDYSVLMVIKQMRKYWKNVSWKLSKKKNLKHYESTLLKLNCNKAKKFLKWKSILNFDETIRLTTSWYKIFYTKKENIIKFSQSQIDYYEKLMRERI